MMNHLPAAAKAPTLLLALVALVGCGGASSPPAKVLLIPGGGWVTGNAADVEEHRQLLAEKGYEVRVVGYDKDSLDRVPRTIEQYDPQVIIGFSAGGQLGVIHGQDAKCVVTVAAPLNLRCEFAPTVARYVAAYAGIPADPRLNPAEHFKAGVKYIAFNNYYDEVVPIDSIRQLGRARPNVEFNTVYHNEEPDGGHNLPVSVINELILDGMEKCEQQT